MAISKRNYYYTITGDRDNTLEKILYLHGIKKANRNNYNTSYKHDEEAWLYIRGKRINGENFSRDAESKNDDFLNNPVIWKNNPDKAKYLKEWQCDEKNDINSVLIEKETNIRSWCQNDVNPGEDDPIEYFWNNERCRFFARSDKNNKWHLIIYRDESVWIPEEPPADTASNIVYHVVTNEEMKNGFKKYEKEKVRLIFPFKIINLPPGPYKISRLTLLSTNDNHYKHTIKKNIDFTGRKDSEWFVFSGLRTDLRYTLEVDMEIDKDGNGEYVKYDNYKLYNNLHFDKLFSAVNQKTTSGFELSDIHLSILSEKEDYFKVYQDGSLRDLFFKNYHGDKKMKKSIYKQIIDIDENKNKLIEKDGIKDFVNKGKKIRLPNGLVIQYQKQDQIKVNNTSKVSYNNVQIEYVKSKFNFLPIVDGHAHIMTMRCASLPHQWDLIRQNLIEFKDKDMSHEFVEFLKWVSVILGPTRDFIRMSKQNTKDVVKIFMCDASTKKNTRDLLSKHTNNIFMVKYTHYLQFNRALNNQGYELLKGKLSDEELEKKIKELGRFVEDGEKLIKIMDETEKDLETLYNKRDLNNCGIWRMTQCMPMDIDYAHYWGQFGIPVYIKPDGDSYYFINDWLEVPKKIINQGMHKLPLETEYDDLVIFPDVNVNNLQKKKVFSIKGVTNNDGIENRKVTYTHFIKKVPANTPGKVDDFYEDYPTQEEFTKAAAVRYPYQILPFYHFDPRRHMKPESDSTKWRKDMINKIKSGHAFYEYRKVEEDKFGNIYDYKGTDKGEIEFFYELKRIEIPDTEFKRIFNLQRTTSDAIAQILNTKDNNKNALFWGVKMYTALGYTPDDFTTYPQLCELYNECINKDIPITVHGSAGGMQVVGHHLYLREALLKKNLRQCDIDISKRWEKEDFDDSSVWELKYNERLNYLKKKEWKKFMHDARRYTEERNVHPENWRRVLEYNDTLKALKLNLAHFAGSTEWREDKKNELNELSEINKKNEKNKKILKNKKNEKLENYNIINKNFWSVFDDHKKQNRNPAKFWTDWRMEVIDMIITYPNVYTDISCFSFTDEIYEVEYYIGGTRITSHQYGPDKMIKKMADRLAVVLKGKDSITKKKLRERIMFGTDFPMYEAFGFNGLGKYYRNMFKFLKEVSKLVEYDAWYQFSVINPMRFIGIIKNDNSVNVDKMKSYKDNLMYYLENKKELLKDKADIPNNECIELLKNRVEMMNSIFLDKNIFNIDPNKCAV